MRYFTWKFLHSSLNKTMNMKFKEKNKLFLKQISKETQK